MYQSVRSLMADRRFSSILISQWMRMLIAAWRKMIAPSTRSSLHSRTITVRMLTSASGSLYTLSEGTLTPLSFTRDGSYIVFRLDNGASIVYLAQETSRTGWIIGGIAGGAAAAAAVVLIIVRKRRKKT